MAKKLQQWWLSGMYVQRVCLPSCICSLASRVVNMPSFPASRVTPKPASFPLLGYSTEILGGLSVTRRFDPNIGCCAPSAVGIVFFLRVEALTVHGLVDENLEGFGYYLPRVECRSGLCRPGSSVRLTRPQSSSGDRESYKFESRNEIVTAPILCSQPPWSQTGFTI
jgi:hypothetical protein